MLQAYTENMWVGSRAGACPLGRRRHDFGLHEVERSFHDAIGKFAVEYADQNQPITRRSSRRSERNGSRRLLNPRSTVRAAASCSILLLALYVMAPAAGFAQSQATPTSVQLEEEKLERDFTDPLSTLPQLILRDSYTPANYGPCTRRACPRDAETNLAIIRPLFHAYHLTLCSRLCSWSGQPLRW